MVRVLDVIEKLEISDSVKENLKSLLNLSDNFNTKDIEQEINKRDENSIERYIDSIFQNEKDVLS